jgi:hypothetical protein
MTSLAPYARQARTALTSIERSERFPLSTSTNSFTSDQLPPFRKSATALRLNQAPISHADWLKHEGYEIHFPSAMALLKISQPSGSKIPERGMR